MENFQLFVTLFLLGIFGALWWLAQTISTISQNLNREMRKTRRLIRVLVNLVDRQATLHTEVANNFYPEVHKIADSTAHIASMTRVEDKEV